MLIIFVFFFQAEDGIRDLVRSRGLGDVYKRQAQPALPVVELARPRADVALHPAVAQKVVVGRLRTGDRLDHGLVPCAGEQG